MKILLTSNGITNSILEKTFQDLIGHKKNLKVALIPTASDPIEWYGPKAGGLTYKYRLVSKNKFRNHDDYKYLKKKGYKVIIADLKEGPTKLKNKLHNVDLIFVGGGDPNYLLDWAKKAKLNKYLKDLLDSGVVYVGVSAGSGLVQPEIGFTWWKPGMKLDHIGLGIVDFVALVHQKESDKLKNTKNLIKRKKHLKTIIKYPWKVYLVKDGQAIKVDGDKIQHIGPGIKKSI